MPAMLDDPTAPAIYRVSGPEPYPIPFGPLPHEITVRQVTLRDRVTIATLIPFSSPTQVPSKLSAYLCELLNREIEKGDTYPMMEPLPLSSFAPYWFANFGVAMIMGEVQSVEEVAEMEEQGCDWARECLGSFYVKPNYPGRSSHVCNGGFLVTNAARNRGVGRLMGECYLEWAPKLGYTYSVFNLVYETNVASLRIWDALGFKRIGRVKGCGNLKSYPDQLIDAIIFGRELGGEGDEYVSEERFDKIRFYLKTGTYPNGSDRAEKSRLRSAATHYRLVPNTESNASGGGSGGADGEDDKLMLKGKEVISDPHRQYEIARNMHAQSHGGINKTTASIAEKYHWVRIKETVSAAIRNCSECKDPSPKTTQSYTARSTAAKNGGGNEQAGSSSASRTAGRAAAQNSSSTDDGVVLAQQQQQQQQQQQVVAGADPPPQLQQHTPMAPTMHYGNSSNDYGGMPVDPQIMHPHQHWQHDSAQQEAMDLDDGTHTAAPPTTQTQTQTQQDGAAAAEDADDVGDRLREELEAQIMAQDQRIALQQRREGQRSSR